MANFDPVQILVSQNKLSQDNAQKILNEANVRRVKGKYRNYFIRKESYFRRRSFKT